MREAFVFDAASGETLFRIAAPTEDQVASFSLSEGQGLYVCEASEQCADMETYLEGGEVALRPRQFDPALILSVAKMERRAAVNAVWHRLRSSSCMTPKGRVDCDAESRGFINGAITAIRESEELGVPYEGENWKMADNSIVFHNPTELRVMGITVAKFISDVQSHANSLKDIIASATSVAELEAINIEEGWP